MTAVPRGGAPFWPLMLGFAFSSFSWNVCTPFLPLRVRELTGGDLGEIARQAGFIIGLSGILNASLAPAWSWVGARFGYRRQVLRAHFGTAIGFGLYGLAPTTGHMAGAALVLGGMSGTYPHYVALAASRAAVGDVGRAVGDLQAASQVGNALGPLVGGLVASQLGVQFTFFVTAALSMVAGVMALRFIPSDANRASAASASESVEAPHEGLGAAFRRPGLRWLMALLLVADAPIIGLRPLIPVMLSARIADPALLAVTTGIASTLATGGTIVAALAVGRLNRRISPGRILMFSLPVTAALVILLPFAPSVPVLVALWTCAGMAAGATSPSAFAWLGRVVAGQGRGGAAYSLLASTSMGAFAIGPIVMGQVTAASLLVPFFLAALCATTAAAAAFAALSRERAPASGRAAA
ncbi:MAG TPA: MFS transporter [Chloroflexota bacterium]|nr:MFS transporter [Chloroflexota bacterium]